MGGAWLKTHPNRRDELAPVSFDAEALWHVLRLYCAAKGNDGTMPARELVVAVQRKISGARLKKATDELLEAGLLTARGDKIELPGWLDEQPPAEVWNDDVQRDRWVRAKALRRDRGLCKSVKDRDRNRCRFCGVRVNWDDRKGAAGGTYDHLDPDGTNSIDNVVVACRRCNGTKKNRTPEQAGMRVLPLAEIARLAAAEESARLAPGSGPNLAGDQTGIRPGSDPGPDSLTCARETGSGQIGIRPGSDRTEPEHRPPDPHEEAAHAPV